MNRVIFQTQTELPLDAITTFGINSKPNSNSPIGFFGTGLKYAIAVLVRTEHKVTFHIGKNSYIFYVSKKNFRDKEFSFISCKQIYGGILKKRFQLPFTTELGRKWELWQAFRELHSNTIDEGGDTYLSGSSEGPLAGHTTIEVEGQDFVEEFYKKDEVFLPEASEWESKSGVQVVDRKSNYVYYRGIRIAELNRPSLYTYNIWDKIDLTEDRTAKYDFEVRVHIAKEIVSATSFDYDRVVKILKADKDTTLEGSLDFSWVDTDSGLFLQMLRKYRSEIKNSSLISIYSNIRADTLGEPTWIDKVIEAIQNDDSATVFEILSDHSLELLEILKEAQAKQTR